jgi:hypothetical protein
MSAINFITTTQSLTSATGRKFTAPQTFTVAQPQPTTNTSSVTISSDAMRRANFEQRMAEMSEDVAQGRIINVNSSNLNSGASAASAYNETHATLIDGMDTGTVGGDFVNIVVGFDISQTLPPGDGILRYSSGETVTPESRAYFKQQAASYQSQALKMYDSEMAKGTPPGELLNKLLDLQGQQPERFRSMVMWPPAVDCANNK